ncbi:hypothetical protein BU25DRAFT_354482, partial [Macroventuria anomochaeta]
LPTVAGSRRTPKRPIKRTRVSSACNSCRARKTKCNNEQPQCSECVKRDTTCTYTESEACVANFERQLEKVFELMRSMPEQDALEVFRRVRMNDKIEDILAHVKEGDLLVQLSLVPGSNRR